MPRGNAVPPPPAPRKAGRPARLLSTRSALIITLAALVGLGGAGLLYLAHRPLALVVLGAMAVFGGALRLFDSLIELSGGRRQCWPGRSCRSEYHTPTGSRDWSA